MTRHENAWTGPERWKAEFLPTAWPLAYAHAEFVGCSYPGEPAGDAVRMRLQSYVFATAPLPPSIELATLNAVRRCKACASFCTAKLPD